MSHHSYQTKEIKGEGICAYNLHATTGVLFYKELALLL
jgi:hypothetical protein